jgi:hypothetical protein
MDGLKTVGQLQNRPRAVRDRNIRVVDDDSLEITRRHGVIVMLAQVLGMLQKGRQFFFHRVRYGSQGQRADRIDRVGIDIMRR